MRFVPDGPGQFSAEGLVLTSALVCTVLPTKSPAYVEWISLMENSEKYKMKLQFSARYVGLIAFQSLKM